MNVPRRLIRRWFNPFKLLILALVAQVMCLLLWGLTWPIELSFVVPQDEVQPWEAVITDFEKDHPKIHITLVTDPEAGYTTDERKAIYTADFQANVAKFDLVYMDIVWPLQFAGHLKDLNRYIAQDNDVDTSDFLLSELEAGQLDNKLYRLPMRADVGLLYYRQDLLQEAGLTLPKTFDELTQVVKDLKARTKDTDLEVSAGYLWQGNRYEGLVANFVEILETMGQTWIDPESLEVGLDTPQAIEAAELLKKLIQDNISPTEVITYREKESLERFKEGQAIFLRGWPYFWTDLQDSELSDKVAIALPFAVHNSPGIGCRGGWGFGIPKNASHPHEAWEAIKYFTSEKAQKQFVLESGYLPSRSALFKDPEIEAAYPQMPLLLEYLEKSSIFRPFIEQYGEVSEILQNALSDVLSGQQLPAAAMQEAQAKTEELLRPLSQGG